MVVSGNTSSWVAVYPSNANMYIRMSELAIFDVNLWRVDLELVSAE